MSVTEDTLFKGRIPCRQHKHGYRFSMDAVLLAHFIVPKEHDHVFDLGCGCGVIPLILLHRHPQLRCSAVELQQPLYELAAENLQRAGFTERCHLHCGDLRQIRNFVAAESMDAVICNPPFYPADRGRASGGLEQENARRQLHGGLPEFFAAARFLLKNRGSAAFIYPAEQGVEFLVAARTAGMEVKRLRHVHSRPGERAKLTLFSCSKNGRPELEVMPPLTIYTGKGGRYTDEVEQFYV